MTVTEPVAVTVPVAATARAGAARLPASIRPRRRFELAMAVVALCSMPMLVPPGPGNTGLPDPWIAAAIVGSALWASRTRLPLHLPFALPTALTMLAGTVAALTAGGSWHNLLALVQDAFVLLWAGVIVNLGREPKTLRTLLAAWAWSASAWAAVMVVSVFAGINAISGINAADGTRAALTFGDPNLAANYFLLSLLVVRACGVPRKRWQRWVACTLIVTAIVLTGSNGGMLGLAVATALGAVLRVRRTFGRWAAVAVTCAVLCLGGLVATTVNVSALRTATQESSVSIIRDSVGRSAESGGSRNALAHETWLLWLHGEVQGIGPGGTKQALRAHQSPYVKEAHDDYLAALVERGPLGVAAIGVLAGALLLRLSAILRRPLSDAYAAVVPRPELLAAAVAACLFSGMFYEVLHFRHVWALFGVVGAVYQWGRTA